MISTGQDAAGVRVLFDRMAPHYPLSDALSLGLIARLRRRAAAELELGKARSVCDLMTGGGEAWAALEERMPSGARLTAVDLSPGMLRRARLRLSSSGLRVILAERDVLEWNAAKGAFDAVYCSLGAKLVAAEDSDRLASRVARMLKPGGRFVFVEMSVPENALLRAAFRAYVGRAAPSIARFITGGEYGFGALAGSIERFTRRGGFEPLARAFKRAGARARLTPLLGGCAQLLCGETAPSARGN